MAAKASQHPIPILSFGYLPAGFALILLERGKWYRLI
jgi:hypothetical protein